MKNKKFICGKILYIISFFIISFYLYIELGNIVFNPLIRIFILIFNCIIMYIAAKLLSNNKLFKFNLIVWFCLYIVFLLSLTLFDTYFNRNGINIFSLDKDMVKEYMNSSFNIIPLKTIKLYFNGYNGGYLSKSLFLYNIIGNLCALMPLSFFLPLLFKKQNNILIFILTIILIVIGIESMQFLTLSGSCDIDDLILNLSGSLLLYLILKIKPINKVIRKTFIK